MSFVRWFWEPKAKHEIKKLRNKRVLEIGAGKHSFKRFFDETCFVHTTDKAQEDARKLSFKNNVFDVVVCFNVLEHIYEYEVAVKEMFRVLKPGGLLFCKTPLLYPLHDEPNDYWRFTPSCLQNIFRQYGAFDVLYSVGFWRFALGHFFIVKKVIQE